MRESPEIYTKGQARECAKSARGVSGFLAGFPVRWPPCHRTAVHYFLMSNKAISMCPDQGPRVLTRVISPGSPACATSSSETDPPLLSPPLSILPPLSPGRYSAHATILHSTYLPSPLETRRERLSLRGTSEKERNTLDGAKLQPGEEKWPRRRCPGTVQSASKGNSHKG